jgi:hypothetical protein
VVATRPTFNWDGVNVAITKAAVARPHQPAAHQAAAAVLRMAPGDGAIAGERARVMQQLQDPATRDLAAWMIGHEMGGREGRTDVLESLVYRAVVTGKHPYRLLTEGFYGPINRFRKKYGRLPKADDWALQDLDYAAEQVGAGRNVLGGRTDQGMPHEVRREGRILRGGEAYGWMGLRGERQTVAARGGPARRAPAPPATETAFGEPGRAGPAQWAAWRRDMEKPIKMHIEAPEAPSRFTPRIRRASAANVQNRELHRERERSYADMEE